MAFFFWVCFCGRFYGFAITQSIKYFLMSMHKMSIIPRNNILKKQLSYHLSSMHSVNSLPPVATVISSST